jgi:hypothetical protein
MRATYSERKYRRRKSQSYRRLQHAEEMTTMDVSDWSRRLGNKRPVYAGEHSRIHREQLFLMVWSGT